MCTCQCQGCALTSLYALWVCTVLIGAFQCYVYMLKGYMLAVNAKKT